MRAFSSIAQLLLPLFVLALCWQLLALSGWFTPLLLPSLPTIGDQAWALISSGILLKHLLASLARLFAGFFIGAVIGLGLGVLMGLFRWVDRFFRATFEYLSAHNPRSRSFRWPSYGLDSAVRLSFFSRRLWLVCRSPSTPGWA